jgi:hypothetical protein
VTAEVALSWLRALSERWTEADVPEAKAEMLHAIYERITVTGRTRPRGGATPTIRVQSVSAHARHGRRSGALILVLAGSSAERKKGPGRRR